MHVVELGGNGMACRRRKAVIEHHSQVCSSGRIQFRSDNPASEAVVGRSSGFHPIYKLERPPGLDSDACVVGAICWVSADICRCDHRQISGCWKAWCLQRIAGNVCFADALLSWCNSTETY